jgi:hypothetical protein
VTRAAAATDSTPAAVIVGAGIAGLSAAAALHKVRLNHLYRNSFGMARCDRGQRQPIPPRVERQTPQKQGREVPVKAGISSCVALAVQEPAIVFALQESTYEEVHLLLVGPLY